IALFFFLAILLRRDEGAPCTLLLPVFPGLPGPLAIPSFLCRPWMDFHRAFPLRRDPLLPLHKQHALSCNGDNLGPVSPDYRKAPNRTGDAGHPDLDCRSRGLPHLRPIRVFPAWELADLSRCRTDRMGAPGI